MVVLQVAGLGRVGFLAPVSLLLAPEAAEPARECCDAVQGSLEPKTQPVV
jgi:hypothetical protein